MVYWFVLMVGYLVMFIAFILGIRDFSNNNDMRWYIWNPIAWVLVTLGAICVLPFKGPLAFIKVYKNAFKNDL